jgi:hypothetical protein
MINLDKCQAIYNGNIANVVHTAEMLNGYVVNLGALQTGSREVFEVSVPATATLGTAEALLIFNDETIVTVNDSKISDYKIAIGEKARAYHLTVGDIITFDATLIDGSPVVGQYLVPQNASMKLAAAADLIGGTRLALEVIEETTIGFANSAAWSARVISA